MSGISIPPSLVSVSDRLIPRYNITPENSDDPQFTSALGTPVYSTLEFLKDNSGTSLDNSLGVGAQSTSDTLLRLDTVLFVVTGTKNVIKTPIVGRNGTVKEYISMGDYQINCKGSIVSSELNVYPRNEVSLLIQILTLAKPISIACEFLGLFGIDNIIIDPEFSISEKLGSRNEVLFEFNAISDFPDQFELSISS